jgi:hypothetical protein
VPRTLGWRFLRSHWPSCRRQLYPGGFNFPQILVEHLVGFPMLFSQPVRTFFASSDRGKHSNLRLAFFLCLPLAILLNLGPALGSGYPALATQLAMRCTTPAWCHIRSPSSDVIRLPSLRFCEWHSMVGFYRRMPMTSGNLN